MKTTRQPNLFKVSWFEVPTAPAFRLECWENFKTRKEAKAMLRKVVAAMDNRVSYRGKGVVVDVIFTECY